MTDVAAVVGLLMPALLGALFRWLDPSDDARFLIAVLVCGAVGLALLPLQGVVVTLDSASTSIVWVWGISQATFKGSRFAAAQMRKET